MIVESPRFDVEEDGITDCVVLKDNEEKLKTEFDSDIVLYPLEEGRLVAYELNVQCATVKMLREQLEYHEDPQDIDYWIKEVREDME